MAIDVPVRRSRPPQRGLTADEFSERQAARRRDSALESLTMISATEALQVPAPVKEIVARDKRGVMPKLPAEAFELARQVYYLQHGTMMDAARAVIASGLSDSTDPVVIYGRLGVWWEREEWPVRSTAATFAIRDANHDGGLYRSKQICVGRATGSGPAPKGKPCAQSRLADSEYCFHHDPRPEYVELRAQQAKNLTHGRMADMVPVEPFQAWLDAKREQLLTEARRGPNPPHANSRGNSLLARALGVDQSILGRLLKNGHTGGRPERHVGRIRASTVVRYADPLGVTFRDIYGYDPPSMGDGGLICPECHGPKSHESKTCLDCYHSTKGAPCVYVNTRGKPCGRSTPHDSGYCYKCRRIVYRDGRPRVGRPSYVSIPMLILALGEYRDDHSMAWISRRMWAVNAAGVRDVFSHCKSLTSALVKQFRKRDWTSPELAATALKELVDEHGAVDWPRNGQALPVEAAGEIPMAPFRAWIIQRHAEVGSYNSLAGRIGLSPDRVSHIVRGTDHCGPTIRRSSVDRALERWGDGTTFVDLYGKEQAWA